MTRAVTTRGVSKKYRIHHVNRPAYGSLREELTEGTRKLVQRVVGSRGKAVHSYESFWALKDITFNLEQGERLGIVGRNGAGKSTLLKLLSRITEPTEGRIEIRGRVSSLLEVGTGFHPELTGRENIFLNGTILGMSSRDIRRKFDEIVSFAEIEQFLDTPVKRYSSGMYVRLAFSVAAHLEPEILIVDEVLAVGDAQFQRKCLGKMEDVNKREGRTVIFVSHNMSAVTSLCTRCLLLERGSIQMDGNPSEVTARYYKGGFSGKGTVLAVPSDGTEGDDVARLRWARLVNRDGAQIDMAHRGEQIGIQMRYEVLRDGHRPVPNIHLYSQGQQVFVSMAQDVTGCAKGGYLATMWIPQHFLNEGVYVAGIALSTMNPVRAHFHVQDGIIFSVVDDVNDPDRTEYVQSIPGLIRPRLAWSLTRATE